MCASSFEMATNKVLMLMLLNIWALAEVEKRMFTSSSLNQQCCAFVVSC